ncbi:MAG: transglutaminase-like domain-containing protein [Desulfobacterales bacterium]|jgi:hypothetical protein
MAVASKNKLLMVGIVFALTFGVLFFIRLDLPGKIFVNSKLPLSTDLDALPERNTWMNIFQKDHKIGFSHKTFSREENGYRIRETVFMRINTMGMVQDIQLHTNATLKPDFSLSVFDFEIDSGRFQLTVHGSISGDVLSIETQSAGEARNFDIKLKNKPYLVAGIVDAVRASELKPGDKFTFDIFDPASMGQQSVSVSVIGKEDTQVMGLAKRATKLLLYFKGAKQFAWIGEDGELLKEKGILGIRSEKTTRKAALSGFAQGVADDLTLVASVEANVKIKDTKQLAKLQVEISGIDTKDIYLNGGRQTLAENILTIHLESLADLPPALDKNKMKILEKIFLHPSPFIQSDHEKIRNLAGDIIGDDSHTNLAKVKKLMEWIDQNIKKRPVVSLPDALSTLENRAGDCNEHAVLLAALARAAGIPARVEAGLVYLNGRFYYHAWNLLYLGRWITADSLFNQLPADVTHIRFTTGAQQQLNLMGIIGRVRLKVIKS